MQLSLGHTLLAMYPDLQSFVSSLARAGELSRVGARVSPVLEIAQIADRVSKSPAANLPSASARRNDPRFHNQGGKALLFENVEGAEFPLLINAYGSYRRMEMALGCNEAGPGAAAGHTPGGFDALGKIIGELVKPEPPRSFSEAIAKAKQFLPLLRVPPKRRKGLGACQEFVRTGDDVDLTRLPIIRCWPHDGDFEAVGYPRGVNDGIEGLGSGPEWDAKFRGRYITLAGIHTIHSGDIGNPKPSSHNIGMYRVQLLGKRRLAMHWHMHHDGARHWRSWKARGEHMPVAIALGGESIMPYAATAPLPPGISELLLAGFLNRGGIPMVMGRTVPVWVPANAEIVIEGYVRHDAGCIGFDPRGIAPEALGPGAVFEGPFGDHTGFYSMPDRYPILEVTAITHRRDPIYPTTIVGLPPQEDYYLGKATERVFFPLLKTLIPDIEDYDLPMYGTFHNAAFLKIKKHYPLQGRRVMHSVWGAGQMAWTKSLLVVDHDCDVHDTHAVLARAAALCRPGRDTETVNGPLDILDHAAPRLGAGMKIGFDATRKIPGEEVEGVPVEGDDAPLPPMGDAEAAELVSRVRALPLVDGVSLPESCGRGWLFVRIRKQKACEGRRTAQAILDLLPGERSPGPVFIVVLGADADPMDVDSSMFHWCASCDASRDMLEQPDGVGRVIRMAFDATPKLPGDVANGQPVRAWPPILKMSEEIRALVEKRWAEYGLGR
jgi:4-hydroxy-3-polyprenylbenzoate decarboxylase